MDVFKHLLRVFQSSFEINLRTFWEDLKDLLQVSEVSFEQGELYTEGAMWRGNFNVLCR